MDNKQKVSTNEPNDIGMNKAGTIVVVAIFVFFAVLVGAASIDKQKKAQCKIEAMNHGYQADQVVQICGE